MLSRLFELSVGNIIYWQDRPHRVCSREAEDHYIVLGLTPQIIIEGSEKKSFFEAHRFVTRPISAALEVVVLGRNSKLEKMRS
jgi:hypothetical protein